MLVVGVLALLSGIVLLTVSLLNTPHGYPPIWVLFVGIVGVLQGAYAIRKHW